MLGCDRFMWYVVGPATVVGPGVWIAIDTSTDAARVLTLAATAVIAGLLYSMHVSHLVRRRRIWRP